MVAYLIYDIGASFFAPNLVYRTLTLDSAKRGKLMIAPRMMSMIMGMVTGSIISIVTSVNEGIGNFHTAFGVTVMTFAVVTGVISLLGIIMVKEKHHAERDENEPAVMLVHNVYYNNGGNAQIMHAQIARHYNLPAVSMQSSIYPEVVAGRIPNRRITEDDLHPNDKGHELVASVITYALEKIHITQTKDAKPEFPEPLTDNCYEKAVRLDNRNYEPENQGFVKDTRVQEEVKDCFKNGWSAKEKGASLTFAVNGSEIAAQ